MQKEAQIREITQILRFFKKQFDSRQEATHSLVLDLQENEQGLTAKEKQKILDAVCPDRDDTITSVLEAVAGFDSKEDD